MSPTGANGSSGVTEPTGQNVSNPFARLHWLSRACISRAVTSFNGRKPST